MLAGLIANKSRRLYQRLSYGLDNPLIMKAVGIKAGRRYCLSRFVGKRESSAINFEHLTAIT